MRMVEICTDGLLNETANAVLIIVDGNEVWIPKSQIEDADEDYETIIIPEWLAEDKGLDPYITDTRVA